MLPFSFYPPFIHTWFVNGWIGFFIAWAVVFSFVLGTISVLFFDKLSSSDLFSPTLSNE